MTENAGLRAVVSKAQIIDELENTLPTWLMRKGGNRWFPAYIHVLKVRTPDTHPWVSVIFQPLKQGFLHEINSIGSSTCTHSRIETIGTLQVQCTSCLQRGLL
jgi:hypothetical protein